MNHGHRAESERQLQPEMVGGGSGTTDPVAALDASAVKTQTPCGKGQMIWRSWGSGPTLLLLHGGHGSWTHWIRNIPALSERYRLLVPDIPGFGGSDEAANPSDPETVAGPIADGLDRWGAGPVSIVGFSFGGVIGSLVARMRPDLVRSLTLVGSGGMNLTRPPLGALKDWRKADGPDERDAAHAYNLSVLMIHDPKRVDELAIRLQAENTRRARGISRPISMTPILCDCLPHVAARLSGIWGEQDATAAGFIDERRQFLQRLDPEAQFRVIPRAGHWVAYEQPELFNDAVVATLT